VADVDRGKLAQEVIDLAMTPREVENFIHFLSGRAPEALADATDRIREDRARLDIRPTQEAWCEGVGIAAIGQDGLYVAARCGATGTHSGHWLDGRDEDQTVAEDGERWTTAEVLAYLADNGRTISPSTWLSYVSREQAPAAQHVGRTPTWSPAEVAEWHVTRTRGKAGAGGAAAKGGR
jgi:hypothetical protein